MRSSIERSCILLTLSWMFALPWAASQTVASAPTASSAIAAANAPTPVPPLVPYVGIALDLEGKPLTSSTSISFLIFKDETGGEPLFAETQTVAVDPIGHYKVQLGATLPNGLPQDLFSTGEARWLEVQVAGEAPQPRVLLVSVPYALKAGDATTLGGLPVSAFALAGSTNAITTSEVNRVHPDIVSNVTTTGGTAGYVPEFNGTATIIDSPIFVSGANVGIGTATPTAALTVAGNAALTGTLTATGNTLLNGGLAITGNSFYNGPVNLLAAGTATTATGFNSQPLKFLASGYNSSTKAAVSSHFLWQSEVTGNNTPVPSATLNLLAAAAGNPVETGFHFNANGTMQFAPGQAFPGVGTITGVTAGTGLTGGGTNGAVTLGLNTAALETTLNAVYPQLSTANSFTGNNTFAGVQSFNKIGIGTTTPRSILEGQAAASKALGPVFTLTNTAGGFGAESALDFNTLLPSSTGTYNPGARIAAQDVNNYSDDLLFQFNKPGAQNNGLRTNMAITPIGQVGIGTVTPRSTLEASVSAPGALGPDITLTNPGGNSGSSKGAASIDFNTSAPSTTGTYNPGARIVAYDDGNESANLYFEVNKPGAQNNGLVNIFSVSSNGTVGTGPIQTSGNVTNPGITVSAYFDYSGAAGMAGIAANGGNASPGGDGGDFYGGGGLDSGANGGYGIYATGGPPNCGPSCEGPETAAYLDGDVEITGQLNGQAPQIVKIDHPLAPADKYLYHASVESSEMMNIYTGNVVTDELGLATVKLPDWFEVENTDFRYQLTVLDERFAQAVVSRKIQRHEFTIHTNASHVEVSWQITAIRQDAYAKAHPLVVEQEKPANERGFYIHPELYGQPAERQTEWGRNPQRMQRMKEMRAKHQLHAQAQPPSVAQLNAK